MNAMPLPKTYLLSGLAWLLWLPICLTQASLSAQTAEVAPEMRTFPRYTDQTYLGSMRLPDSSLILPSADSTQVGFVFPDRMFWVQPGADGELALHPDLFYACQCAGGGCTVVYFESMPDYGCSHGDCEAPCLGGMVDETGTPISQAGGFVDFGRGISFLPNMEDGKDLLPFREVLLDLPGVQAEWQAFQRSHFGRLLSDMPSVPEKTRRYIPLDFFGTSLGVMVSPQTVEALRTAGLLFTYAHCACAFDQEGCIITESEWSLQCGGGGCTACRMTIERVE